MLAIVATGSMPAGALEFSDGEDWRASLDTTLSIGVSRRVQAPSQDVLGMASLDPAVATIGNAAQRLAPGRWSVNADDADLLYRRGDLISQALKLTTEFSFSKDHWGAFVRASAFEDHRYRERAHLSGTARDRLAGEFQLLDAFVFADFAPAGHEFGVRIGRQVASWGESTFLQGGINVFNPVDLSRLRVAGAELKEALLPVDMLLASMALHDDWSLEAAWLFEFEQVEIDPAGSYFSNSDFSGPGGRYVMVGFGLVPQPVLNPDRYDAVCFGGAASDIPAVAASEAMRAAACASALPRVADEFARDRGQFGLSLRYVASDWNSTEFALHALNYHSRLPMVSGFAATSTAANSARVQLVYPEDIHLYAASFNTALAGSGVALQGEVSHRPNAPLQIDDVEILFTALSPLNPLIPQPVQRFVSQLGDVAPGAAIRGWNRHALSQWQLTASKAFPAVLGADQVVLLGEVGGTRVWDLPAASVLRYQGEGTDTGGGADVLSGAARNPITQAQGFATAYSWGYRTLLRAEFNNAWGTALTLAPRLAFNHDVHGISPGPGGNFLEGRRSLTVGAELVYLQGLALDLSYTRFSGARPLNTVHDRDFAAITLRYSF